MNQFWSALCHPGKKGSKWNGFSGKKPGKSRLIASEQLPPNSKHINTSA
jgi:hypothetical protein